MADDPTPRATPAETRPTARRRTATPTQRLLTGKQIEEEYGIPYRSVYDLHVSGKLPAVRFTDGGQKWFRRADVDALIQRSLENSEQSA